MFSKGKSYCSVDLGSILTEGRFRGDWGSARADGFGRSRAAGALRPHTGRLARPGSAASWRAATAGALCVNNALKGVREREKKMLGTHSTCKRKCTEMSYQDKHNAQEDVENVSQFHGDCFLGSLSTELNMVGMFWGRYIRFW